MIKMIACCDCKIPNLLYLLNGKRVRETKKNMVASTNNVAAPAATKKTESEIDRDRIRGARIRGGRIRGGRILFNKGPAMGWLLLCGSNPFGA